MSDQNEQGTPFASPAPLSAAAAVAAIEAHPNASGTPAPGTAALAPDNPFAAPPPIEEDELPPGAVRSRFLGPERSFWWLLTRGAMLLAITLGIYRFWLATD